MKILVNISQQQNQIARNLSGLVKCINATCADNEQVTNCCVHVMSRATFLNLRQCCRNLRLLC